jgi:DNA-directed RNA polymerase specialized sigma54-like protein
MARAMFEYTKTVLSKVSFDSTLFCKELQKALQRLLPYEIEELKIYIKSLILQNPELDQNIKKKRRNCRFFC